ncbi:MAG: decaprenyl-phosphate phosphoribosyltransferase [Candidatus Electryoneaceae bacterium]|nr:decaprenyl-phosphate phosphoribosyltransferase [Candidatus Electryoneaceae bacterium]
MKILIRLLRPKQWSKNSLIFAALVFSQRYGNIEDWLRCLLSFASFSLVASSVYIVNDILDVEDDRRHPIKRNRPIASGEVRISTAIILAIALLAIGLGGGWLLGIKLFVILITYKVVMLLYSIRLKHIFLVDVFILAGGLTVRAVIGAEAIDVEISHWLLVCTFFIALTLALVKRRQELARISDNNGHSRKSLLQAPSVYVWDMWITMVSGITILAYTLYTVDPITIAKVGSSNLMYTVPFVVFSLFRYQVLIYSKDKGEDPTETILGDRWILLTILVWLIVVILVLKY